LTPRSGEVEGRRREIEEVVVAIGRAGHQYGGRVAALATAETGVEAGGAGRVGGADGQHLVVAGQQPQFDAGERLGGGERAHQRGGAVLAAQRREAEVRHHEPLRGDLAFRAVPRPVAVRRGLHDVDAGLHPAHGVEHREGRGHILVQALLDVERARPHRGGVVLAQALEAGAVELAQELVGPHRGSDGAVADAQDLDVHLGGIDRHHRDAGRPDLRQHIGAADEAHLRGAVAHVDLVTGGLQQVFAHRRRQSLADLDPVALPVLQPLDADLPVLGRDGGLAAAVE